jgi:transglutaminase-like putative cysteine protease
LLLRVGYEFTYECVGPTPMLFVLNVHSSRVEDMLVPDHMVTAPPLPITQYFDSYGNLCSRLVAPAGQTRVSADAIVRDAGILDAFAPDAGQHAVQDLPDETLQYLLSSRYCEVDLFGEMAWDLFGGTPEGWWRVQAICDFVHERVQFGYEDARATRTAWETYHERVGVCRDFTHLAVALCRAMNIPARYCTGYLADVGMPPPHGPGDFAAWFEAYLDGRWYTFDPRNNVPRFGRVLVARGHDASDVPLSHSFGPNTMTGFDVWTHEVDEAAVRAAQADTGLTPGA